VSSWVLVFWAFMFCQAANAIRAATVTGVQTCALPILDRLVRDDRLLQRPAARRGQDDPGGRQPPLLRRRLSVQQEARRTAFLARSEERRVGKGGMVWCARHSLERHVAVSTARAKRAQR